MARYKKLEDLVEIEGVEVYNERPRSIFITYRDNDIMIPKSQVGATSEVQGEGDSGVLVIPRWLAKDRGMLP